MAESTDRAALFAEGDRAFAELCAVLDADPTRPLHGEDGSPWIARDVYAHLDRWQRTSLADLATSLRSGEPVQQYTSEAEMDAINAAWRAEAASLSHAEARARCIASNRELQEALLAIHDEAWDAFGHRYAEDVDGSHYRGHLAYIRGEPGG